MKFKINNWDCLAVFICLLPLSYLFIGNIEWVYAPLYSTDSYMNHAYSYFYDYPEFKSLSYKSSRVPWISFLFYLQKVVGPYLLQPVVVVGGWITINYVFYLTIKKITNRTTAITLLPWIVFFPDIIGTNAGGGTYHANAASVLFLLALYFWTEEKELKHSKIYNTVAASFLFATAMHIGIVHLNLFLLFPAIDIYKNKKISIKKYGILFLMFFGTTAIWGAVNYLHGRDFLFWKQMFKITSSFVAEPELQKSWWINISINMFYKIGYLSFHFVLFIAALYKVIKDKFLIKNRKNIFAYHYVFICLLWVSYHLMGHTALHPPDFVYPLQIPAFIFVATWIAENEIKKLSLYKLVISIVFLWLAIEYSEKIHLDGLVKYEYKNITGYILLIFALICAFIENKIVRNLQLVAIILTYSMFSVETRAFNRACRVRQESNDVMVSIVEKIKKIERNPDKVFVYGNEEYSVKSTVSCSLYWPTIPIYKIMHSTWSILGNPLNYKTAKAPKISDLKKNHFDGYLFRKGIIAVFPFDQENFLTEFIEKTKEFGFNFVVIEKIEEEIDKRKFPIYLLTNEI